MSLPRRQSTWVWLADHAVVPVVLPVLLVFALIVNIWYDVRHPFALFVDLIVVGTAVLWWFLKWFLREFFNLDE
jgi:hypothetical protein